MTRVYPGYDSPSGPPMTPEERERIERETERMSDEAQLRREEQP